MKTSLATIVILLFTLLIIYSCSNKEITKEERLQLIEKKTLSDEYTVYHYKFNFEGNAWMDVAVYVKKELSDYIISMNDKAENNLNIYTKLLN